MQLTAVRAVGVRLILVVIAVVLCFPAHAAERPLYWNLKALLREPSRLVEAEVVAVRQGFGAEMRVLRIHRGTLEHELLLVPERDQHAGRCQGWPAQFSPGSRVLIGLADRASEAATDDGMPIVPMALENATGFRLLGRPMLDELVPQLMALSGAKMPRPMMPDRVARTHLEVLERVRSFGPTDESSGWLLVEAICDQLISPNDDDLRPIAAWALDRASHTTNAAHLDVVGQLIRLLRERGMLGEFIRPVIALCDHPSHGLRYWSSAREQARWSVAWFAEQHGIEFDSKRGAWAQLDAVQAILEAAEGD